MKLATWNCCGKFSDNLPHLLGLDVDVAVVGEGRAPETWPKTTARREVNGLGRRVWAESWKELLVVATEPWTVALHEQAATAPDWTLPVRVSGPVDFTLVGLWPVVFPGTPSYVAQIDRAVDWIEAHAALGPTVLGGDFNAPIASSQRQYDSVVMRLDELGLQDAYRVARGLLPGEQPGEATYYQHRRVDRPFHIDHVFVPAGWAQSAKVEVGDHATWIASGRSDHAPIVVEIDDQPGS